MFFKSKEETQYRKKSGQIKQQIIEAAVESLKQYFSNLQFQQLCQDTGIIEFEIVQQGRKAFNP